MGLEKAKGEKRIRSVAWLPFRLPYADAFTTSNGAELSRDGVLILLRTQGGLEGLGEASPVATFAGGTKQDVLLIINEIAPRLLGLKPTEIDLLLQTLDYNQAGMAAVACAIDIALCDLRARSAGVSLARYLSKKAQESVPVNFTLGLVDNSITRRVAQSAVEQGYRCVKLKVGVTRSLQSEIERVGSVREAIGADTFLRLDANGAWNAGTAITIIKALERFNLEFIEQPVPADDITGMAQVRGAVNTPIAADESVKGPEEARRIIAAGAADLLVIKPMVAGGLRRAREIMNIAHAAGVGATVTTTIDSGVGNTAALHLAATIPLPAMSCGLATGVLLEGDLCINSPVMIEGRMKLPEGPGLGIALDEEQIKRYGSGWQEIGQS